MDSAWSSYSAAIVLSILALVACTHLSSRSRQEHDDPRRLLGLIVAVLTGVLVLLSPLAELSDRHFSAHMIEHELLLFTAPLALLAAKPFPMELVTSWRVAPSAWRRLIGRAWNGCRKSFGGLAFFGDPLPTLLLFTAVVWLWHVPWIYDRALESEWLHAFEHVCFLAAAFLYWRLLLSGGRITPLNSNARRTLYLMVGAMQGGLLGALIALHSRILYTGYLEQPGVTAQSALTDQQIGGAIMWFSGPIFYAIVAGLVME